MINGDKDFSFTFDGFDGSRAKHFNIDGSMTEHVTVWVEAHDDKRFWLAFLKSNDQYKFSMKAPDEIKATDGKTATGCNRLFSLEKQGDITLAKHNIFCLDSDDSFIKSLIPTYVSKKIARDHLFSTNVYAIENAILELSLLDDTFVSATGLPLDRLKTTPSTFLKALSRCVFAVYKDAYFLEAITNDSQESAQIRKTLFDEISILASLAHGETIQESKVLTDLQISLKKIHSDIEKKIKTLNKIQEHIEFDKNLETLGISPENIFLFLNGHLLFDIVCGTFQIYSEALRAEEEVRIRNSHKNSDHVVRNLINDWPVFSEALKFSFLARKPDIPFLSDTLGRLSSEYPSSQHHI